MQERTCMYVNLKLLQILKKQLIGTPILDESNILSFTFRTSVNLRVATVVYCTRI